MNQSQTDSIRSCLLSRWKCFRNWEKFCRDVGELCSIFDHQSSETKDLLNKLSDLTQEVSRLRMENKTANESAAAVGLELSKTTRKLTEIESELAVERKRGRWDEEAKAQAQITQLNGELQRAKEMFQSNLDSLQSEIQKQRKGNFKLLKFIHESKRLDAPFNPETIRGMVQPVLKPKARK